MTRLIDADDLKDWSEIVPLTGDGGIDINDFDEKLKSMPAVDAVPVIRCKDCRFLREQYLCINGNNFPAHWCKQWAGIVPESGFCHLAERKEE